MNIISIDYASEVSAIAIISHAGRVKRQERVVSTVPELCRIIKGVARPRQVVFEEGPHAAWLSGVLARWCDDVLVCDPRQLSELARRQKTDRKDASDQGLWAHAGLLRRIWHGGTGVQSLREAVRMYIALTRESTRLKNGIKGVFRSCGKRVQKEAYHTESRKIVLKKLSN